MSAGDPFEACPDVVKTTLGYYALKDRPATAEIRSFYENRLYQEGMGSYEVEYSEEELSYFRMKNRQVERVADRVWSKLGGLQRRPRLLDVGCGEGFALAYFRERGYEVRGFDYSEYGIRKFNPDRLADFSRGDVFDLLGVEIDRGTVYDLVLLDNVLEHVLEPETLLERLHALVAASGVLCLEVPNDFSPMQGLLLSHRIVDRPYWLKPPIHISYFTAASLRRVAEEKGWVVETIIADYPVEWHLMNAETNYVTDPARGKGCHLNRIRIELALADLDIDGKIALFEQMAAVGQGRTITAFLSHHPGAEFGVQT